MSQRSIEDFKAVLQGGGVRPTMFEVQLEFPDGVSTDGAAVTRDGTFLIKAASLPASQVGSINVPFRGRSLKVSGDRVFDDWNVTIVNDVSFGLRSALEEWSEKVQSHVYALGTTELANYFASAIVRQLDRDGKQLRAYRFEGIWPKTVSEIGLDFENLDSVEQYDVSFAVQYWIATPDGDPEPNNVARDPSAVVGSVTS